MCAFYMGLELLPNSNIMVSGVVAEGTSLQTLGNIHGITRQIQK